jgi:hypothetical protein
MSLATAVANLEAEGQKLLADDRWKSSKLWATLAAIVLVLVLHHFGIDLVILLLVAGIVAIFLVCRLFQERNQDFVNGQVAMNQARCDADVKIAQITADSALAVANARGIPKPS